MEKTITAVLEFHNGGLDPAVQMSLVTLCKAHSLPGCSFSICCDTVTREHLV